jgi:hypothetical protein
MKPKLLKTQERKYEVLLDVGDSVGTGQLRLCLGVTTQPRCARLATAHNRDHQSKQAETEGDVEVPAVTHAIGHIFPLLSEAAGQRRVVKRSAGVQTLVSEYQLAGVMAPQQQQRHDNEY